MNINGKTWKIVVIVLLAIGGVIYGYGHLNGRFEDIEKKVEKAENNG